MISVIVKFLYFLITCIERYEYRNLELDQDDVNKKILESISSTRYSIKTDTGFKPVSHLHKTQPYRIHHLKLENGLELKGADLHIVYTDNMEPICIDEIKPGDNILTEFGYSKALSVESSQTSISMFDVTVDDENHRYYSNGILSHNTVSAAITILHYAIFNTEKNIMIAANKKDTVVEIMDKIKSVYILLPFFLKPGVKMWNQKNITFGDTDCRIKAQAATKSAGIGFTIDMLYLDEFAHINNNIAFDYYRSLFPTVSAVQNSKIIITSTPNGMNLFYNLLTKAELPKSDPDKNDYASMRVYWHQVPGRHVTTLRLNPFNLDEYNITDEYVFNHFKEIGFDCKKHWDHEKGRWIISIENKESLIPEAVKMGLQGLDYDAEITNYVRCATIDKIKIASLGEISSWKLDAIKNIGSEEAFSQEYDLQFIQGSSRLFPAEILNKFINARVDFEWVEFERLNQLLSFEYKDLKWIKDRPDLFHPAQMKNYNIVFAIDLSEGLGQDYTVINIFRLMPKSDEIIKEMRFQNMYDFFKLEQIGIFHSNTSGIDEIAEMFYALAFELFDSEKSKAVLEINTYGSNLLSKLPKLYDGMNNYGSFIFLRYKHRIDAEEKKIGLKIKDNKNILVEVYQRMMRQGNIIVHHQDTINEIMKFIKKPSKSGALRFEAETGHDDIVMTLVGLSTVFEETAYKDLIEQAYNYGLGISDTTKRLIEERLGTADNGSSVDYGMLTGALRRNKTVRATPPSPFGGGSGGGYGQNPYGQNPYGNNRNGF